MAGFLHAGLVEIDRHACETLRLNRPDWNIIEGDLRGIEGKDFKDIDLLAGGVPCPPFSVAGKQLGQDDERDLFPQALRLIEESRPKAIMLENVPGFASAKFADYRRNLISKLRQMGYKTDGGRVLNASDYDVSQLRPRFILVALLPEYWPYFRWPRSKGTPKTVGRTIGALMGKGGWPGTHNWVNRASGIAPTIVGGSKKHGGPDLGPTRAKAQWRSLGVDGLGIADLPPGEEFPFDGVPRLTVEMVARLQGFPNEWHFAGKKTAAYRQVGNALPPPVAEAVGNAILNALNKCATGEDEGVADQMSMEV